MITEEAHKVLEELKGRHRKDHPGEGVLLRCARQGMFSIHKNGHIWRHQVWRRGEGGRYGTSSCTRRRAEQLVCDGYLQVRVTIKGRVYSAVAHRLVWMYFNGTIPMGLEINHKNGKRADNKLKNLEPLTPSQNVRHGYKRNPSRRGKRLSDKEVEKFREEHRSGNLTIKEISDMTGRSRPAVSQVLRGGMYRKAGGPLVTGPVRHTRPRQTQNNT